MQRCRFTDEYGSFVLENAGAYRGLYFPLAGQTGLKSAVSPYLAGDAKTDQNHFLLPPVSIGELFSSRLGRNFWCVPDQGAPWSAVGSSAAQTALMGTAREESCTLEGGYMWQRVCRTGSVFCAQILSFVLFPAGAVLYFVNYNGKNELARSCGRAAWFGCLCILLLLWAILGVAL